MVPYRYDETEVSSPADSQKGWSYVSSCHLHRVVVVDYCSCRQSFARQYEENGKKSRADCFEKVLSVEKSYCCGLIFGKVSVGWATKARPATKFLIRGRGIDGYPVASQSWDLHLPRH